MNLIDRLRDFQQKVRDAGFGMSNLALPAPRLLLLDYSDDAKEEILFGQLITEPELYCVSGDLFESGFYSQAVAECFKALNKFIQKKSKRLDISDTALMQLAFSEKDPLLFWSDRSSVSEKDEQKGYMFLFAGSFMAIRNPTAHEINWIDDHKTALDAILIAQHLLRKAKTAYVKV